MPIEPIEIRRVPGERNSYIVRFPAGPGPRGVVKTSEATPEQWKRLGSGKPHHRPRRPKRS